MSTEVEIGSKKPLFRTLDASEADDDSLETSEIESMCMNCGKNGITRLLLTKIPMFREIILMSFSCPHCYYADNEMQPGGPIQDQGVKYIVQLDNKEHLSRLVVKADSALVRIPHLDFEIPAVTQKGRITTIEGILDLAINDLDKEQSARKITQPDIAEKLETFIQKLRQCREVYEPFSLELDDPSGNSYVENKLAPSSDPKLKVIKYNRSEEQNEQLGLSTASNEEAKNDTLPDASQPEADEVLVFHTNCSNCQSPTETRMKLVDIPHFKQVVIMATSCDTCGHKSNEVKSGAGISPQGVRWALHITDPSDLSRDILKGETASLEIPELDLVLQHGTLGGQFTTVEGLLTQVKDNLLDANPFLSGDSDVVAKFKDFTQRLEKIISGDRLDVQLILDDPAGNSYIQNTYAPETDPELAVNYYERSFDQNEQLGLNDMKTEHYTN